MSKLESMGMYPKNVRMWCGVRWAGENLFLLHGWEDDMNSGTVE